LLRDVVANNQLQRYGFSSKEQGKNEENLVNRADNWFFWKNYRNHRSSKCKTDCKYLLEIQPKCDIFVDFG
jgi:type I site-specific restriction-modification system R (restriction) subunit